jgi:integrase/recombinase XerD
MRDDRGLSPITVEYRCGTVRPFLERLLGEERSLESVSVSDIDSLLLEKVNAGHYARISVRAYASSLRAFFRYATFRGWCRPGIATSVMAPRVFRQEALPSGPSWEVVQAMLDATAGNDRTELRDHALLLLFATRASGRVSAVTTGHCPTPRAKGLIPFGGLAKRSEREFWNCW